MYAPTRVRVHHELDAPGFLVVADRYQGEELSERLVLARVHQFEDVEAALAAVAVEHGSLEVVR